MVRMDLSAPPPRAQGRKQSSSLDSKAKNGQGDGMCICVHAALGRLRLISRGTVDTVALATLAEMAEGEGPAGKELRALSGIRAWSAANSQQQTRSSVLQPKGHRSCRQPESAWKGVPPQGAPRLISIPPTMRLT